MDCRFDHHEFIEQYLQGQLQPDVQDEFEVHMLGCDRCQQALELLETARHDLMQRAHIIRAERVVRRIDFRWKWAVSLAGLVLIACGLARWNMPSRSQSVVVPPQVQSPAAGVPPNESFSGTLSGSTTQKHDNSAQLGKTPSNSNRGASSKTATSVVPPPMEPPTTLSKDHSENLAPDILASLPEPVPPFLGVSPTRRPTNADDVAIELFKLSTVKPPPPTYAKLKYHGAAFKLSEKIKGYQQLETLARAERWVFHDAMAAYNKGDYEKALRLLDDAVHIEPDATDVNFYIGICRLVQGHSADSLQPLEKAFDKPDSPITQAAHFYLAKAHLQLGHLVEAQTEFKGASEIPGPLQSEAASSLEQLRLLRAKSDSSNP